jgi:hypothetical protein
MGYVALIIMNFKKFNFWLQIAMMPIMYVVAVLKILVMIPMCIIGICNYVRDEYLSSNSNAT